MSLTELELNQQLIEALAERDRLRAEHCKTISARYEVEMERDRLRTAANALLAAASDNHGAWIGAVTVELDNLRAALEPQP